MSDAPTAPSAQRAYLAGTAGLGVALLVFGAPSWLALLAGVAVALFSGHAMPGSLKPGASRVLQAGVVALGAGMNLDTVLRVGASGALLTAASLVAALGLAWFLGRRLAVSDDLALLLGVGTAICGGSAIAAVASVTKPKAEDLSVSLAVVFLLNALGLLLFPPIGQALGLTEPEFGRWAALAIHDTSSVVGAGLAFGSTALQIATTTKLARALWIVPVTLGVALWRHRGQGLGGVKWPWFIGGFVATAALFTWVPALGSLAPVVVGAGRSLMVLALFLVGLGLSPAALRTVGVRPLVLGVVLWVVLAIAAVPLARLGG